MNYASLLDGTSAAIVIGGTLLATLLRCGVRDCIVAIGGVANALRPRFDAERARAELALQIQDIHSDGLLRAEAHRFGDREFDEVADTLIEKRSLSPLLAKHRAYKAMRARFNETTVATLGQAAEMGPVFGLVGTLIALSQLRADGSSQAMLTNSIPGAIITTFYGLIIANLVFAPLARFVQRRADAEEEQRQDLIGWLTDELAREGVRAGRRQGERVAA